MVTLAWIQVKIDIDIQGVYAHLFEEIGSQQRVHVQSLRVYIADSKSLALQKSLSLS